MPTYGRNDVKISVETVDGFGKNPGLWIATDNPNMMVKVASFGNEDKANMFCKWFEYITGLKNDREAVKYED